MTDDTQQAALRAVEQQLGTLGATKKPAPPRTTAGEAFNVADHMDWHARQELDRATAYFEFCRDQANLLRRKTEEYVNGTVSPKFFNGGGNPQ